MKFMRETASDANRILDLTREGWAIDRATVDWALTQTGDLRCSQINTVAECREQIINFNGEQHGRFQR